MSAMTEDAWSPALQNHFLDAVREVGGLARATPRDVLGIMILVIPNAHLNLEEITTRLRTQQTGELDYICGGSIWPVGSSWRTHMSLEDKMAQIHKSLLIMEKNLDSLQTLLERLQLRLMLSTSNSPGGLTTSGGSYYRPPWFDEWVSSELNAFGEQAAESIGSFDKKIRPKVEHIAWIYNLFMDACDIVRDRKRQPDYRCCSGKAAIRSQAEEEGLLGEARFAKMCRRTMIRNVIFSATLFDLQNHVL